MDIDLMFSILKRNDAIWLKRRKKQRHVLLSAVCGDAKVTSHIDDLGRPRDRPARHMIGLLGYTCYYDWLQLVNKFYYSCSPDMSFLRSFSAKRRHHEMYLVNLVTHLTVCKVRVGKWH